MELNIHGYAVLVDKDDYEMISNMTWSIQRNHSKTKQLYARTNIYLGNRKHKTANMHRIIMKAKQGQFVDHINGNTLDNRKCNLRFVNRYQNARNCSVYSTNKTGYKGVSWSDAHNGYRAYIAVKGKNIALGIYKDPKIAYAAYCEASKKYHGEYGRVK